MCKSRKEYNKMYHNEHKKEENERSLKYYNEHKEERKLKTKEWKAKNKDKIREYNKKYREEHKEKIKEKAKEYIENHKEEIKNQNKIRCREWYLIKENRAKMLIKCYKKDDKQLNRGECTLTPEQLISLWENGCFWCGETDWHKLGADRIDNKKAHTLENCVCACKSCNDKRNNKTFEEFKEIIQRQPL